MHPFTETLSNVPLCAPPYRLNRAWFVSHRADIHTAFHGQWVGIANEKIFAHPTEVTAVYAALEQAGIDAHAAYILLVPH